MQTKYHIYKKSLIKNWKTNDENLLEANIYDTPYLIVQKSNDEHFVINYTLNDENKYALDYIEDILNSKNGPEHFINEIMNKYKNYDYGIYELDDRVLPTLNFWSNRWNSTIDTEYLSIYNFTTGKKVILQNKKNIDRVICLQLKDIIHFNYAKIEDDSILQNFIDLDYELDNRILWKIDNSFRTVLVKHKEYLPLCFNPIGILNEGDNQIFYIQLSPYTTIFSAKKEFFKRYSGDSFIIGLLTTKSNYKLFFNQYFYSNYFARYLSFWYNSNNSRISIFPLSSSEKEIKKYIFEIISIALEWKMISNIQDKNTLIHVKTDVKKRECIFYIHELHILIQLINKRFSREEIMNMHAKNYKNSNGSSITKKQKEEYFNANYPFEL